MIINTEHWLSVRKFAEKVGVNPANITHYIKNGSLKTIRMGNYWFIHKDSLSGWPPRGKIGRPKAGIKKSTTEEA